MKQFYLTALLIMGSFMISMAQFTLESESHGLKAGDEHYFIITEASEEGPSGYNRIWDFSGLEEKSEMTSHMLPATSVEEAKRVPKANVVLEEFGTHFFYKTSNDRIEQHGTITTDGGFISYDLPIIKLTYPFEYQDFKWGSFSGQYFSKYGTKRKFGGYYSIEVDGFGKLILPGDVELDNVVRLKTVKEKYYENSHYGSVVTSYKWYCKELTYPLLTVVRAGTSDNTRPIKTAYYAKASELLQEKNDQKKKSGQPVAMTGVRFYPNPFTTQLKVDYGLAERSDVRVTIFDVTGKKVKDVLFKNQAPGNYSQTLETSEGKMSTGLYHLTIQAGDKQVQKKLLKVE